jgi:hypothetical protein
MQKNDNHEGKIEKKQHDECNLLLCMWKARLDSLSRPLGEEGNPLHSPDVSSTRLRGGPDTNLQVTSKKERMKEKAVAYSLGC